MRKVHKVILIIVLVIIFATGCSLFFLHSIKNKKDKAYQTFLSQLSGFDRFALSINFKKPIDLETYFVSFWLHEYTFGIHADVIDVPIAKAKDIVGLSLEKVFSTYTLEPCETDVNHNKTYSHRGFGCEYVMNMPVQLKSNIRLVAKPSKVTLYAAPGWQDGKDHNFYFEVLELKEKLDDPEPTLRFYGPFNDNVQRLMSEEQKWQQTNTSFVDGINGDLSKMYNNGSGFELCSTRLSLLPEGFLYWWKKLGFTLVDDDATYFFYNEANGSGLFDYCVLKDGSKLMIYKDPKDKKKEHIYLFNKNNDIVNKIPVMLSCNYDSGGMNGVSHFDSIKENTVSLYCMNSDTCIKGSQYILDVGKIATSSNTLQYVNEFDCGYRG